MDYLVAHESCDRLLKLRNRVAHHEPVFEMDLQKLHEDAMITIAALSSPAANYLSEYCTVQNIMTEKP